jgi:hypothetical protein
LEVAVREGLDQPPPRGPDFPCEGEGVALSMDECTLLSSGWTFDARRDAFEGDLLDRIGRTLLLSEPLLSMSWHDDLLAMSSSEGMAIAVITTIEDGRLHFHDEVTGDQIAVDVGIGAGDDAEAVDPPASEERTTDTCQSGSSGMPTEVPVSGQETHDPGDRQSAWAEALARMRRSGTTATSAAAAAGLRMNDNTRHALLRGGIPTDHVLVAICGITGVSLSVARNPKGTPGDPRHYPHLAEAISRRSTMTIVSRDDSGTTKGASHGSPKRDDETESPGVGSQGIRSTDVGAALLRILTKASTSDETIDGLRRRTSKMLDEASEHRRRADAAESRSAEFLTAIAGIRSVIGRD